MKSVIGAFVAALIFFVWQFLSWAAINLHSSYTGYTENQEEILACLEGKLQEGSYMLPNLPEGASEADYKAYQLERGGKPWAIVQYHNSMSVGMGMNLFRGFTTDLFAMGLLVWLFTFFRETNLKTGLIAGLTIGFMGFLLTYYTQSIWFKTNVMGDLIDAVVPWSLSGIWLDWWLGRK
ncbi:MAG: hypothetical protein H6572_03360 [Lewinellaceae bacterium]|nr:hypothetical protein [Lewinellaceae bacterium]